MSHPSQVGVGDLESEPQQMLTFLGCAGSQVGVSRRLEYEPELFPVFWESLAMYVGP